MDIISFGFAPGLGDAARLFCIILSAAGLIYSIRHIHNLIIFKG